MYNSVEVVEESISLSFRSRPPGAVSGDIAPERRCSSRTFRYGYLVTTSPPLPSTPSAPPSLAGWADDFGCRRLGWCDGRCVQGPGTHSPRRADPRLLATPTSWRRVAASNPNWGRLWGFAPARAVAAHCAGHCSTCAAQDIRGMMT